MFQHARTRATGGLDMSQQEPRRDQEELLSETGRSIVDELRNRLQDLEGEKDTEIKALRHRYAAKRKPNEAAIKSKQGSHCQHALCSVWSTAGNHRFTHLKALAVHDACDGTVPVERPSAVAITRGAA